MLLTCKLRLQYVKTVLTLHHSRFASFARLTSVLLLLLLLLCRCHPAHNEPFVLFLSRVYTEQGRCPSTRPTTMQQARHVIYQATCAEKYSAATAAAPRLRQLLLLMLCKRSLERISRLFLFVARRGALLPVDTLGGFHDDAHHLHRVTRRGKRRENGRWLALGDIPLYKS